MLPDLPSLTALQAFDAALRHESFTRAAEELCRTQGAVSRQILALEQQVGVTLFHREPPRVRPTRAAVRFGQRVRQVLDRLAAATLELQASGDGGGGGVLHLAILPTLGTKWLIPRVPEFHAAHPDVVLQLTTRLDAFDFDAEEIDAALHYGSGVWPDAEVEHVMAETVTVIAQPEFAQRAEVKQPLDLLRHPLLHLTSRPRAWREWFLAAGEEVPASYGARFEHYLMVLQATLAGLGFAVVPTFVVEDELREGSLVEPFPRLRAESTKGYWLAWPKRNRKLPQLQAFRQWLAAEVDPADG